VPVPPLPAPPLFPPTTTTAVVVVEEEEEEEEGASRSHNTFLTHCTTWIDTWL